MRRRILLALSEAGFSGPPTWIDAYMKAAGDNIFAFEFNYNVSDSSGNGYDGSLAGTIAYERNDPAYYGGMSGGVSGSTGVNLPLAAIPNGGEPFTLIGVVRVPSNGFGNCILWMGGRDSGSSALKQAVSLSFWGSGTAPRIATDFARSNFSALIDPALVGKWMTAVIRYDGTTLEILTAGKGDSEFALAGSTEVVLDIQQQRNALFQWQTIRRFVGECAFVGLKKGAMSDKDLELFLIPSNHAPYLVSLFHFDGLPNSTTFIDHSNKSWSANGNVQMSGNGSAIFDGSGDWLETGPNDEWDLLESDFTVRGRIAVDVNNAQKTIISKREAAANSKDWVFHVNDQGRLTAWLFGADNSNTAITGNTTLQIGQEYDFEFCRKGEDVYIFLDGQLDGQGVYAATPRNAALPIRIGRDVTLAPSRDMDGQLFELAIIKGAALHTKSFAPSMHKYPVGNSTLLTPKNHEVGVNYITDQIGGHIWQGTSGAALAVDPVSGQKGLYVNGNNSSFWRSNSSSSSGLVADRPFDISCTYRVIGPNSLGRAHGIYGQCRNAGGGEQGVAIYQSGQIILFLVAGVGGPTLTMPASEVLALVPDYDPTNINTLRHVFDGNTHWVLLNGVLIGSLARTVGWLQQTEPFRLGQLLVPNYSDYRHDLNGYIYDFQTSLPNRRDIKLPTVTPPVGTNVALGKYVYYTGGINGAITYVTDGNTVSTQYVGKLVSGPSFVEVDLGTAHIIDTLKVWHYYADSRTYHDTKVEVSEDGENWTTVFDSTIEGEYVETASGKTHTFTQRPVRYIRDWVNGNSVNAFNHWVEIQAFRNT